MWGIIPAAGLGSRIQPLAFSKELLPVGSRIVDGAEHLPGRSRRRAGPRRGGSSARRGTPRPRAAGFRLTGAILADLHALFEERGRRDAYVGTLVNAWLAAGNGATAVKAGEAYVDVGTLNGYHEALRLLAARGPGALEASPEAMG